MNKDKKVYADVVRARDSRGRPQTVIPCCPYCGGTHMHGYDEAIFADDSVQHKNSHCSKREKYPEWKNESGYWLVASNSKWYDIVYGDEASGTVVVERNE